MTFKAEKTLSDRSEVRARELKPCPSCNALENQQPGALNAASLMRCVHCGSFYEFKNPHENKAIYSESYFASPEETQLGYFNYEADRLVNLVNFRIRFNYVEKLLNSKNAFLDVGCALGHALDVAAERGWKQICGIDCSEFCVRTLQDKGYFVTSLSMEQMEPAQFDFIMMSDVIEHFSEPQKEIEAAFHLLKPGGILFINTPNSSSLSARLMKSHWFHFKPGEHLVYYSKKGLRISMVKAGFSEVEVKASLSWLTLDCVLVRLKRWGWKWLSAFDFLLKLPVFKRIFFPIPTGNMQAIARKVRE